MHQLMARTLDEVARRDRRDPAGGAEPAPSRPQRPAWPMIVLRTPKGWTGPKVVDGLPVEGTLRSHQVPLAQVRDNPAHLAELETWLRSYRPEELFDANGRAARGARRLAPRGARRMGANPHANGGLLLRDLELPDFRDYAVDVPRAGVHDQRGHARAGRAAARCDPRQPRTLPAHGARRDGVQPAVDVFEVTDRAWDAENIAGDDHLAPDGRVMEVLSEHLCQGWLEGYLLTGRHGLVQLLRGVHPHHRLDVQPARQVAEGDPRHPVAPADRVAQLPALSHVWRQDHNGFSHQDPGFIDHVVNKKAEIVRVYLPPDANSLLSVADHCLRSRDYVNVVVAGKQPALELPDDGRGDRALHPRPRHLGVGSSDDGGEPDVVLACAGDIPTLENVAAAALLREHLPN